MWTIDPKIPLGLWWALGRLPAVAHWVVRQSAAIGICRRSGGRVVTMLMGLGVVGPLLIALNPTWVEPVPPLPGQPVLSVLVDGTMSMQTRRCDAGRLHNSLASGREDRQSRAGRFAGRSAPLRVRQRVTSAPDAIGRRHADTPTGRAAITPIWRTSFAKAFAPVRRPATPCCWSATALTTSAPSMRLLSRRARGQVARRAGLHRDGRLIGQIEESVARGPLIRG